MSFIKDLIDKILNTNEDDSILDARIEFRLNNKEKILIKKYCDLKRMTISEFIRSTAMKEIDTFINANYKGEDIKC
ncbi:DUF6290 family protein [Clostridium disporicum]|uniref:DUF6290 family protein n=1 Tax=Clostridium disporicum TaxID=84024 RepID=UPI0034A4AB94